MENSLKLNGNNITSQKNEINDCSSKDLETVQFGSEKNNSIKNKTYDFDVSQSNQKRIRNKNISESNNLSDNEDPNKILTKNGTSSDDIVFRNRLNSSINLDEETCASKKLVDSLCNFSNELLTENNSQIQSNKNLIGSNKLNSNYNNDINSNYVINVLNSDQLIRTSSNASTGSSNSTCSSSFSIFSSNDLTEYSANNPNHFKALKMSTSVLNPQLSEELTSSYPGQNNSSIVAAFADQFANIIRSRSSSFSESSISSSNSINCTEIIKKMINNFQSNNSKGVLDSPVSEKTSAISHHSIDITSLQLNNFLAVNQSNSDVKCDNFSKFKNENLNQSLNNICKVCGDEASGFHYGVDSCEGCKGFFRRCITQGMNHQCTNSQQCEMTPFSRNSCQFCRLKKCFAVGMSREASRLGRRPKRAKDDNSSEILLKEKTPIKFSNNIFKNKDAVKPLNSISPISENNSQYSHQLTSYDEIKASSNTKKEKTNLNSQCNNVNIPPFNFESFPPKNNQLNQNNSEEISSDKNISIDSKQKQNMPIANKNYSISFSLERPVVNLSSIKKENSQQSNDMFMENEVNAVIRMSHLYKLFIVSNKHISNERKNELEEIRVSIIDSHLTFWPTTFEKIKKRYLEKPPIRILESNQLNYNVGKFLNSIIAQITDVVKFTKNIPGFSHINQSDQLRLLTQGSFELICVNSFTLVDEQNKLMLTPDMEYLIDQTSIKKMSLGFFINDIFELGIKIGQFNLSDEDTALYNALIIMNPDREELKDRDLIEEIQSTIMHSFYRHLKYYRSDEPDLFFKLLELIPCIQKISLNHSELLHSLFTSNS